jgi:hypothetical protein
MYKIEKKTSGYLLTFAGNMDAPEMQTWFEESQQALADATAGFCVVIDMRTLAPLSAEAQAIMVQGQQLYQKSGMKRSSVVVNNAVTAMQFKRLAKQSGIYLWERYFDGSQPGALEAAIAWGRDGLDSDI